MGKARIISGGTYGYYRIEIIKNTGKSSTQTTAITARIAVLETSIANKNIELSAANGLLSAAMINMNSAVALPETDSGRDAAIKSATAQISSVQSNITKINLSLARMKLEKDSLNKSISMIDAALAVEQRNAWCTDYTDNLAAGATVGTIEVNMADDEIIIMPGGTVPGALGLLKHAGLMTGSGIFVNKALLPCVQKWKPTFRVGRIVSLSEEENTCSVGIVNQFSEEQGLPINQSGVVYTNDSLEIQLSGWDDYCARNPDDPLVANTENTQLSYTAQLMADMQKVQSDIQNRNHYKLDKDQYGQLEHWTTMQQGGSGDCEDYALTKAAALIDLGYPASAIHIECGITKNGDGHAYLVVQTDQGDYVMDNMYKGVIPYSKITYKNRRRQTGPEWKDYGVLLSDVPIVYMDGIDAEAFEVGDMVVVEFIAQNWDAPRVIGFETNPKLGLKDDIGSGYSLFRNWNGAVKHTFPDMIYKISDRFIFTQKYYSDLTVYERVSRKEKFIIPYPGGTVRTVQANSASDYRIYYSPSDIDSLRVKGPSFSASTGKVCDGAIFAMGKLYGFTYNYSSSQLTVYEFSRDGQLLHTYNVETYYYYYRDVNIYSDGYYLYVSGVASLGDGWETQVYEKLSSDWEPVTHLRNTYRVKNWPNDDDNFYIPDDFSWVYSLIKTGCYPMRGNMYFSGVQGAGGWSLFHTDFLSDLTRAKIHHHVEMGSSMGGILVMHPAEFIND